MSDQDFAALFAISQAAPGPNVLIATLIGWKAAGLAGAVVATVAMCGPSCFLVFWVSKVWDRYSHTGWRAAVGAGIAPIAVGLVCASALVLVRAADASWRFAAVTAASAAIAYFTKLNPLWCLAGAALLGLSGLLLGGP